MRLTLHLFFVALVSRLRLIVDGWRGWVEFILRFGILPRLSRTRVVRMQAWFVIH